MFADKLVELEKIDCGDRICYPIAKLSLCHIQDKFMTIDYQVVAFRIKEENTTYYINISLTDDEFNILTKTN